MVATFTKDNLRNDEEYITLYGIMTYDDDDFDESKVRRDRKGRFAKTKGSKETKENQESKNTEEESKKDSPNTSETNGCKKFKTVEEADKVLRADTAKVWNNMSVDEKLAVFDYTSNYYQEMNGYLRTNQFNIKDIDEQKSVLNNIKNLSNAIDKSVLNHNVQVERGVSQNTLLKTLINDSIINKNEAIDNFYNKPIEELKKILTDKEFTEKGFTSTSVKDGCAASGNTNIIYNISLKKGTKCLYVEPMSAFNPDIRKSQYSTIHQVNEWNKRYIWNGISPQTQFGNEGEIILQKGTKFKIKNVYKNNGGEFTLDLEII